MRSVAILCARFDEASRRVEVAKEIVNDDGSVEYNCQTFHPDTLEWWAAGFDTDDVDEVIDGILIDPFVPPIAVDALPHRAQRDAYRQTLREAKVALTPANGNVKPVEVNSAALKARMRAVGIGDVYVDAVDNDPYEVIKAACPFDPEVLQVRREQLTASRAKAVERSNTPSKPAGSRADEARRRLNTKPSEVATAGRAATTQPKRGELPPIVLGESRRRGAS